MVEPKVSLSLLIPGADRLSSQECDKNPKKNYQEHKLALDYMEYPTGKKAKRVKEIITFKTRKPKLITQTINIGDDAYKSMLDTPTTAKLAKIIKVYRNRVVRVWDTLSVQDRLKHHFDLIAHDFNAVNYKFEILDD